MKQPKTFLFLSIIVAVLVLGIAYAAITREFVVTGTASSAAADASKFAVTVTNVAHSQEVGEGAVLNSDLGDGIKTVTYSVTGMKNIGDTAKFVVTLTNASEDLTAVIDGITTTVSGDTGYFKVYGTAEDKESDPVLSNNTIAPDGTATFTVYVELVKNTLSDTGKSITITTAFSADAQETAA